MPRIPFIKRDEASEEQRRIAGPFWDICSGHDADDYCLHLCFLYDCRQQEGRGMRCIVHRMAEAAQDEGDKYVAEDSGISNICGRQEVRQCLQECRQYEYRFEFKDRRPGYTAYPELLVHS